MIMLFLVPLPRLGLSAILQCSRIAAWLRKRLPPPQRLLGYCGCEECSARERQVYEIRASFSFPKCPYSLFFRLPHRLCSEIGFTPCIMSSIWLKSFSLERGFNNALYRIGWFQIGNVKGEKWWKSFLWLSLEASHSFPYNHHIRGYECKSTCYA